MDDVKNPNRCARANARSDADDLDVDDDDAIERRERLVRAKSRARKNKNNTTTTLGKTTTTAKNEMMTTDSTAEVTRGNERNASSSSSRPSSSSAMEVVKAERMRKRTEEQAKREAFDAKYKRRQTQGVPEIVTDRMLRRVGMFCGAPLALGFACGPTYYFFKAVKHVDVPPQVFFAASTLTFGAALFGISWGILSASWDPREEGTFWGGEEFKTNVPILVSTVMGKASGTTPLEWDDESDVDF